DSQDHILAAMDHAFAATGATLPAREAVLSIVGLSLPVAVERLVPHLPDGTRADIVAADKASSGQLRASTLSPPFPGPAEARAAGGHARRRHGKVAQGPFPYPRCAWAQRAFRHDPGRRRPPVEAAPLDASRSTRRDGDRGRAGGDDRRHDVRHRDGAGRRHGHGGRRLGLSSCGRACRRRRRHRDRAIRRPGAGARRSLEGGMTAWKAKRFWKTVTVVPEGGSFAVRLDARPVKTPAKRPLLLPTRAMADAVAAEWA